MTRQHRWCLVLCGLGAWSSPTLADQFEQLDGPNLARTLKGSDASPRTGLTMADIGGMPPLLRDTRSALVLARTDQGNPVRLLLAPELRKPSGGQGEPIPVVVLERLDTFDASDPSTRLASRRDVVVFDGFQVDLDTGQVVPPGQGGISSSGSRGRGGLAWNRSAKPGCSPCPEPPSLIDRSRPSRLPARPSCPATSPDVTACSPTGSGRARSTSKWRVGGVVTGQFRSDLHGTTYPVSGQVAADIAQKVWFAIKYPRARQEFEGYLWAEGRAPSPEWPASTSGRSVSSPFGKAADTPPKPQTSARSPPVPPTGPAVTWFRSSMARSPSTTSRRPSRTWRFPSRRWPEPEPRTAPCPGC